MFVYAVVVLMIIFKMKTFAKKLQFRFVSDLESQIFLTKYTESLNYILKIIIIKKLIKALLSLGFLIC